MSDLARLSFSLDASLEGKLGQLVERHGYANRSEFIRDMIRERLVADQWEENDEAVGTITLVYDHHARGLHERLTDLQHEHHDCVLATTHVHLDHHRCVEVVLCHGAAGTLREIADRLQQQRGVLHGTLSMSSTGRDLT
jgi:CopG family nickel-responsive transcriptional regulator